MQIDNSRNRLFPLSGRDSDRIYEKQKLKIRLSGAINAYISAILENRDEVVVDAMFGNIQKMLEQAHEELDYLNFCEY